MLLLSAASGLSTRLLAGCSTPSAEALGALKPPLRPLAAALAPHKVIVECGDGGTCGPASLARVLAHARLGDGDTSGDAVRQRVVAHAKGLLCGHAMWCPLEELSVRELIEESFATWFTIGRASSVNRVGGVVEWGPSPRQLMDAETWLKLMARRTTWIDQAFLHLAADCFNVEIAYHVVSGTGAIGPRVPVIEPRESVDALARVELAYVVDQHFCAILPSEAGRGGEGSGS